eukprot:11965686-Karenia_brevis.AAC.1
MILGDGKTLGACIQKYYCQQCNTMPLRDGQWYLFSKSNGKKLWVCPACGAPFSMKENLFLLGMKYGEGPHDVMYLKAACPNSQESAIIDLFKLNTNMGGKGIFEGVISFAYDDTISIIRNMIDQSEHAAWPMLHSIPREELRLINPMP